MPVGRQALTGRTPCRALATLFALSVLVAGCRPDPESGGDEVANPVGPRCLHAGDSCLVASGAAFQAPDLAALQASCEGSVPPGTFVASASCPTTSAVSGYCQLPDTSMAGVVVAGATMRGYYYWPAFDATAAAASCASDGGTWVAGSGTTLRCLFSDSCDQLTGELTAADLTSLEGLCGGVGGSYAVDTCPASADVPGYCATSGVGPSSDVFMMVATYYAAPWDAATAAADCSNGGGSWVGGASACGDGTITGAEVCDGADLGGEACTSQGFTAGVLACAADCLTFDTSACTGPTFDPTGASESEENGMLGTADGPYTTDHLISAAISAVGDVDYFAVQNATGAAVTVRIETSIGGVGLCLSGDTVLSIRDGSDVEVGYSDDYRRLCSRVDISIPAGTTYYARVIEYQNDGTIPSYQVEVDFP